MSVVCSFWQGGGRREVDGHAPAASLNPPVHLPTHTHVHPFAFQVYLATYHEAPAAVKVLVNMEQLQACVEDAVSLPQQALACLQKEAGIIAGLRHPNLLQLLGVCMVPPAIITGEAHVFIGLGLFWLLRLQHCLPPGCTEKKIVSHVGDSVLVGSSHRLPNRSLPCALPQSTAVTALCRICCARLEASLSRRWRAASCCRGGSAWRSILPSACFTCTCTTHRCVDAGRQQQLQFSIACRWAHIAWPSMGTVHQPLGRCTCSGLAWPCC